MNDQHPHAGYAGYDSQATGSFDSDPLFGSLPGGYDGGYGAGQTGYSGQYDSAQWDTGAHPTTSYDTYAPYATESEQQPYAAGPQYGATATWTPATAAFADLPEQAGTPDATGQWETNGWHQTGQWATTHTAAYDTGAYDATAWNTGATPEHEEQTAQTTQTAQVLDEATATHGAHGVHGAQQPYEARDPYEPHDTAQFSTAEFSTTQFSTTQFSTAEFSLPEKDFDADRHENGSATTDDDVSGDDVTGNATGDPAGDPADAVPDVRRPLSRPATRGGGGSSRSRRRSPAKRSALLTVAVPSACVMSVAGIAAASVGGLGGEDKKDDSKTTMAAADPGSVKPVAANNKLDTQLANLSADAENFADRASRTQERIDLRERQAAEKKKREDEAARKEALRPKYVIPVARHGLSAYFGQAGVNWMSVHTGIDFPVLYGTPVMAATDGTVRTQWNNAYGNMAIVTMADGTETWYCHLSSTKIRSGPVKAGDVIAYSGDSGNSTGPHMHFEVRPSGGAAIDPLPWLRSHGVNPT
ncbi:M23 family metallopeptidase [Streptomyces sp. NPDC057963]|uniref:M23 family metallopeptidase n=1 Tax=Streptomyces sp. NPDC057963 TaxID=3346290 RepID=UPI0036E3F1C1